MTHETVAPPYETAAPPLGSPPARNALSRLPSLTGARIIAAGLVFFFHTAALYPFASPKVENIAVTLFQGGGFTGVAFFFVLSGFVLTWAARPGDTTLAFWRRRLFKIYPTHLLTFLAALLLVTVASSATLVNVGENNTGFSAVLNLFLVQSWNHNLGFSSSWNGVAWSLSCEALFYACFPFLIRLINKIRPERLWVWTVLSAASVISLPALSELLPTGLQFPQGYSDWQLWFVFHCPPTQMLLFIFGIFMAKIVLTGQRVPLGLGGAIALAVTAYFVTPLFPALYSFSAVMVIPLGLVIAAGAVADIDEQPTFLGSRPMVWLGNISFAFYMWHFMVLTYGHHWLGAGEKWSTPTALAVMALLLAVTLALSAATFTFFERPIMRRFATSRRNRNPAAVTTDPAGRPTGQLA